MAIFDCFPFAGAYEADLLYLKLQAAGSRMTQWIIVESPFTFQGTPKEMELSSVLTQPRFDAFKDRILVMQYEQAPDHFGAAPGSVTEEIAFRHETNQREHTRRYLAERLGDRDWVFISDVDECIDLQNSQTFGEIQLNFQRTCHRGGLSMPCKRYIFEFDFAGTSRRCIGAFTGHTIRTFPHSLLRLRQTSTVGPPRRPHWWSRPPTFEYSFCFPFDAIVQKIQSYSHTTDTRQSLERALHTASTPTDFGGLPEEWLEQVTLTEKNSLSGVRLGLTHLRTGNIPADYAENRARIYPSIWTQRTSSYERSAWIDTFGQLLRAVRRPF